jgi:hypothetical protein
MGPALNLNLQSSAIAEQSKKWLIFQQIDLAPLEGTLKYVYQTQLEELHSILESSGDRTVEQFVAAEEMQALTTDFWLAVVRSKREEDEKRKEAWASSKVKGSEAAEKWKTFRRMGRP